MERTLVSQTPSLVGKKVFVSGWVNRRRDHGKLIFIEIRDRSGILQVVGDKKLDELRVEDVVELEGMVKKRPSSTINPKLITGRVELEVEKVKKIVGAKPLPFDLGQPTLQVELPTLLDHRPLSLRHPKVKAVFEVQEVIIQSFREKLINLDFTEFFPPTLVPTATEGGAEVFPVKYFDHWVYLAQSPQFYKQMMVSIFERGFAVTKAYRAEPSVTTRHLTEYISLDCEFGFITDWSQIMDVAEETIKHVVARVEKECASQLDLLEVKLPSFGKKVPRIKMREAQEIIFKRTGRDNRKEPDLEPEDEREICRWSKEEFESDYVFITHYPTKKRPFYTFPDPADPDYTLSFDLIGTGFEWVTGGQRIHDYDQLVANIKKWGYASQDYEIYLQAFRYGMPPEGGFAIGAERITQGLLGLKNIREASLFPRDMERVDIRLSELKSQSGHEIYEKIINRLEEKGCYYQAFKHQPVSTSQESAEIRGTSLDQGAKALIVEVDKRPVMAVLSAASKMDTEMLAKLAKGKKTKLMGADKAEELTGLEIGAILPFGSLLGLPTFVDEGLGKNKEIVFNAGEKTRSVKMSWVDYLTAESPLVGRFAKP